MAITLGKNGSAPAFGAGIISVSVTNEAELIDVTNRTNSGSGLGYKTQAVGFGSTTYEVECHDGSAAYTELTTDTQSGFSVVSMTENAAVDGVKTYTLTLKYMG